MMRHLKIAISFVAGPSSLLCRSIKYASAAYLPAPRYSSIFK